MTQRASELTPAELVARAKKLHIEGDHQAAIAASVIAIAEQLLPIPSDLSEVPL